MVVTQRRLEYVSFVAEPNGPRPCSSGAMSVRWLERAKSVLGAWAWGGKGSRPCLSYRVQGAYSMRAGEKGMGSSAKRQAGLAAAELD